MNIWFTSDTHFGHTNIIKYCGRPFSSTEEHDNTLIDNINILVSPKDTLYHLGDFAFHSIKQYRERINCKNIILVRGNHDRQVPNCFSNVYDIRKLKLYGYKIIICHFAMRVWDNSHHGSYHLYGHSHNTLTEGIYSLSFDCGVDGNDYKPWSFEEVIDKMKYKERLRNKYVVYR